MAVKSFQAKLVCRAPSRREHLELTHRLFNEHLAGLVPLLYAARRGDHGEEYAKILATVTRAQAAKDQIEAISSLAAKPGEGGKDNWKDTARSLLASGRILFDRKRELPGFSSEFRRKIFETSFQIILGHQAKLDQWHKAHEQWVKSKADWEGEHPEYLAVRPIIERFAEAEGKVSKRRGRWHRWLAFLESHPELAAWRGGDAVVEPLTAEERREAAKQRRRAVAKAFERFWAKNPEVKSLDETHGYYERVFVRRWAKRCNPDGFTHRPTFTLPSWDKHPAWYQFKKNNTYRNLDLTVGTIDLKVITADDPEGRSSRGFTTYRFRADHRLRRFSRSPEIVRSGRINCDLVYYNAEGACRAARVQGVKLVFRQGQPYLYFSCYIEEAPSRLSLTQEQFDRYSATWVRKKVCKDLGGAPRTMAIDLGIRHIAVATVMDDGKLVATRFIHNSPKAMTGEGSIHAMPTLGQIAAMKRQLRQRLGQRGKPVKGEQSCRRLQAHIRHMSEDRFKKSAVAVVDVGRAFKVDIILVEQLEGLVPDAARERGINRALVNWNRRHTVSWIKTVAPDYGLRVLEIPPYWTSRICHRCDSLGQRYSLSKGEMKPGAVEKLFGCPSCGYQCNADFNASINLHRVFLGTFPKIRSMGRGRARVNGKTVNLEDIRRAWQQRYERQALDRESPF